MAALFAWWAVHCARARGVALRQCIFLASTVSSPILQTIAQAEGMQYYDTLSGFKWIGHKAAEIIANNNNNSKSTNHNDGNNHVLFAFEESIGFMWGTRVLDKDGVNTAGIFADLTCYLHTV